uniref:Uncharacterized protein n=1 Tax=Solibacter usitatus (strain Ellin6076) TaxID=234267 RepID=Q01VC9_SOLUE
MGSAGFASALPLRLWTVLLILFAFFRLLGPDRCRGVLPIVPRHGLRNLLSRKPAVALIVEDFSLRIQVRFHDRYLLANPPPRAVSAGWKSGS